jgi:hypothetical protein
MLKENEFMNPIGRCPASPEPKPSPIESFRLSGRLAGPDAGISSVQVRILLPGIGVGNANWPKKS